MPSSKRKSDLSRQSTPAEVEGEKQNRKATAKSVLEQLQASASEEQQNDDLAQVDQYEGRSTKIHPLKLYDVLSLRA